jgi:hypothetical protein
MEVGFRIGDCWRFKSNGGGGGGNGTGKRGRTAALKEEAEMPH